MAKIDSTGAGESGKPRPQAQSSFPAREPAATAALGGDTVARSSSGPRELPPQFGPYRVKQKLGGGGMGTVYLVENTALEREEALKVPHFGDGDDPQLRERFLREARSAAKLDHANLCPIYAAGVQDGIYYLTMRFLRGKLLSDYTGKPQPVRKSVEIVTKLAQALEAAHAEGVIHRDLKPSNVIMVAGVGPVVMDFGLAKQVRQLDQKLTQMGAMLGTPAYMPPEQVNGDLARMGPPSDVYSLGVILYELLTGRLPFEGSTAAIFGQILSTEPPLPSTLVRGLNPALDGICRKAMAKVTTERYPSMKAFAAALMDYLRSTPATDGAGNLVPTIVDKAAFFQAPTAVPGLLAAVKADIFQAATLAPGPQAAATVPPQVRSPVPPTQTAGKAPSALRKADGAGQPAQAKSTSALKWFALAAVAGSAVLCLCLSTVLLVWLASRAGVNPPDNDALANGKTNKEQVDANDKANSKTPDSKPAEPEPVGDQEVKKDEVKYDMDQFEKDFGLKFKTAKLQPGKAEGDTLITMTLEFTKDVPSALKGGFPPIGGIPYKSLEGLRTVLDGGMIREGLPRGGPVKKGETQEGSQLRCYFFDDEGVRFTKQAPGKIDGAVSGVKGDSFRISQSVPNAVLAETKKISYRAEPFRAEPFKK